MVCIIEVHQKVCLLIKPLWQNLNKINRLKYVSSLVIMKAISFRLRADVCLDSVENSWSDSLKYIKRAF